MTPHPMAQAALTNNPRGAQDGTLAAVSGSGADAAINDNFAELHTLLDEVRTALVNFGLMKGARECPRGGGDQPPPRRTPTRREEGPGKTGWPVLPPSGRLKRPGARDESRMSGSVETIPAVGFVVAADPATAHVDAGPSGRV